MRDIHISIVRDKLHIVILKSQILPSKHRFILKICGVRPHSSANFRIPIFLCRTRIDIWALPTVELEGFGLVTLEALACGTPVLGTPIGGTSEILGQLDRRFLFKDPKPESLAALIIATAGLYLDHSEQYREDAARCRRFAVDNYSWEKNVGRTEELFRDAIQTR